MNKKLFLISILFFSMATIFAQESEIMLIDNFSVDQIENGKKTAEDFIPKMIFVSGGSFVCGAENQEENEKPFHNVLLNSFYISETEVTQKDYESVMKENYSRFKGDNLPVEEVSWYDAIVFCNRLSMLNNLEPVYSLKGETNPDLWGDIPRVDSTSEEKLLWNKIKWNQTANGFRLPTEAEWEYAAKEGSLNSSTVFSGDDNLDSVAWFKNNSEEKTNICASKKSNALGLYDMNGNVWEWCWDWYDRYNENGQINPVGGKEKIGGRKVRKGGSFKSEEIFCRNTNRASSDPSIRGRDLGFRIARSAESENWKYLSKNDLNIDFSETPYSVLFNSYKGYETAVSEKNRLKKNGMNSNIVKTYSSENYFSFDVHSDFVSTKEDAEALKEDLKKKGFCKVKVTNFSDYESSYKNYDSYIESMPVFYGEVSEDKKLAMFSDSVMDCLKVFPLSKNYQLDYFELADVGNVIDFGKNLSGLMIEDFFGEESDKINAACYGEFSDSLFGNSLIVVTAKANENYFDGKAESFASTFMDGVYKTGSYDLEIGDLKCSVVTAFGQLVLCGNSSDGSTYILIFARGFQKEGLNEFISNAYEFDSETNLLKRTLYSLPDESESKRFLKFVLTSINSSDENINNFEKSLCGYLKGEADFFVDEKNLKTVIYPLEYDFVSSDVYKKNCSEKMSEDCKSVLLNGTKISYADKAGKQNLYFAKKSCFVDIASEGLDEKEILDFASGMKIW